MRFFHWFLDHNDILVGPVQYENNTLKLCIMIYIATLGQNIYERNKQQSATWIFFFGREQLEFWILDSICLEI